MKKELFLNSVLPYTTNEEYSDVYAEHLSELFSVLDLKLLGLENESDVSVLIKRCAAYFRQKPDFTLVNSFNIGTFNEEAALKYLKGTARVVNIDWTFPDGEVDFLFDPTEVLDVPINYEWLWQFNRHNDWSNIARAYRHSGNKEYLRLFSKQLLKWIGQTAQIPERWNDRGSAWRTIECGLRLMGSWLISFDGFKEDIDDVPLLLMIASMHRQAVHLAKHPTGINWLMMESNGLFSFSVFFSELTDAQEHRKLASERLLREMELQILPDGMHNELSPDYQHVVFRCATNFYEISKNLGFENELPPKFKELIISTTDSAIKLASPGFIQPKTNDTFTKPTSLFTERTETLFGTNPQYRFINSARKEGAPPDYTSVFLDYAGFAVMRSDWSENASYLCFDVGPLGCAHCHQDKLNINIFKGAQELIYDDGGGEYNNSAARIYAVSGYSHNTVLVDGLAQMRKSPNKVDEPIDIGWKTNDVFDYACASYEDGFGDAENKPATHKREIRFIKPDIFCVSDTLTSLDEKMHEYEILFHLDTTEADVLPQYKNAVISHFKKDYEIAIIPIDEEDSELNLISGERSPRMQGWYNGRNDENLHKALAVTRKATAKSFRFNTLLIPVKTGAPVPLVEKIGEKKFSVTLESGAYVVDLNNLNK